MCELNQVVKECDAAFTATTANMSVAILVL